MLLLANVDDISGELIPHAIDGLMALGAGSVHVVQAITKKGRLEYLFMVDAEPECIESLANYMAMELGTLGVRVFDPDHIKFSYQMCQVQLTALDDEGAQALVRVKQMIGSNGQVISVKAELEDLRSALREFAPLDLGLSFKGLKRFVEQVVQDQAGRCYNNLQATVLGGQQDEKDPTPTG